MSIYSTLLPSAMIGTAKQAAAVPPLLPDEVRRLATAVAAAAVDDSRRMLDLMAILAACTQAGAQGQTRTGQAAPAASEDTLPAADAPVEIGLLQWVFAEGPLRLQVRTCLALEAARRRLPETVLPAALGAGQRVKDLREPLLAVIGERGRWLARLNDEWKFADGAGLRGSEDERWAEGSLDERRALLRVQRRESPAAARERLVAALPELPVRERVDLLRTLGDNLSMNDEVLLLELLNDRGRDVRQLAAGLLSSLPQSALARRASARVDALLKQERVKLRMTWVLDAPTALDDDWKADGIDATRPTGESLGERGWWMYQLARQVPLPWWVARLEKDPSELIQWALRSDWAEALLRGWRDALAFRPEPAWCQALLDQWPEKHLREDPSQVLALLPMSLREKYWGRQLAGSGGVQSVPVATVAGHILMGCTLDQTLSVALSTSLIERLRETLTTFEPQRDWYLRDVLPELGVLIAREQLPALGTTSFPDDAPASLSEVVGLRLQKITVVRQTFGF